MRKLILLMFVILLSLTQTCIADTPYYFTSTFNLSLYSKDSTYESSGYFPLGDVPASMPMAFVNYFDKNGKTRVRDNTNLSCRINANKTKQTCHGFEKYDPRNGDICTIASDITVTTYKPLSKSIKRVGGWAVFSLSMECYSGYFQWAVYNGQANFTYKPAR